MSRLSLRAERKDLGKKIRNLVFNVFIWKCLLVIQIRTPNRQLDEESGVEGRDQAGERNLKDKSLPMVFKVIKLAMNTNGKRSGPRTIS